MSDILDERFGAIVGKGPHTVFAYQRAVAELIIATLDKLLDDNTGEMCPECGVLRNILTEHATDCGIGRLYALASRWQS